MSKKKINFIIPYFGKFPNYFPLFLMSCKKNAAYQWTIITDNKDKYDYPENVAIILMTFEEVVAKIQRKFDFPVVLESTHKLCEYKPAYGYIFEEYLSGYEFWGYCDIDVIYGNIEKFLTDEVMKHDKLFTLGHMTVIRNNSRCNQLFMTPLDGIEYYKKAFSSQHNFNFDEDVGKPNINDIFRENGLLVWDEANIADIYTKSSDFHVIQKRKKDKKKRNLFVWENGSLYNYMIKEGKLIKEEFIYIHLQKRKMKMTIQELRKPVFKIIPNSFEEMETESIDNIEQYRKIHKKNFNMQYFRIRAKNLWSKIKNRIHDK